MFGTHAAGGAPPAVGVQILSTLSQDGTPPGQLRVEAALSLKLAGQAPAAPPAGSVAVQLMRGQRGVEKLGAEEHVTEEAVVAASVDGPGTYGLWCVPHALVYRPLPALLILDDSLRWAPNSHHCRQLRCCHMLPHCSGH